MPSVCVCVCVCPAIGNYVYRIKKCSYLPCLLRAMHMRRKGAGVRPIPIPLKKQVIFVCLGWWWVVVVFFVLCCVCVCV